MRVSLAAIGCGGRGHRLVIAVQDIRVEIEPVRPCDRPQLGIDPHEPEQRRVAKRLAQRAPQLVSEIDDTPAAVVELETQLLSVEGFDVCHGDHGGKSYGD